MLKFLCCLMITLGITFSFSQVGIGTNSPSTSAILDVTSSSKGFLMPRLSTVERNAITNPADGLQIFNTTTGCINYYNKNVWQELCLVYPSGSIFCNSGPTKVLEVVNPTTGKTWMDRNLGASQVATSPTDVLAYGDLYQWGRGNDGHQCRTSISTTSLSSLDQPGHGYFIYTNSGNKDWRSPQNINLWQGINGINNPCPIGYRVPTFNEFNAERLTWLDQNSAGAYNSVLKLPLAGSREYDSGIISLVGTDARYWTSTIDQTNATAMIFGSSSSSSAYFRAFAFSVRCIKN
jgi:hypothetical protein